jgi:hypothetical protein
MANRLSPQSLARLTDLLDHVAEGSATARHASFNFTASGRFASMLLMAFPSFVLLVAQWAESSAPRGYLRYLQIHLSIAIGVVSAIALNVMTGPADLSIVYTHVAGLIALGVMLMVVGVPMAALAVEVRPPKAVVPESGPIRR